MFILIIKDSSKYYRINDKGRRFYCRKVGDMKIFYPSVTTIISQDKKSSSGSSPSMSIGTVTHYHILKRYSKKLLTLPHESIWNMSKEDVFGRINRNLLMWNNLNLNIKPICVETGLFCEEPRLAGTLDLLARIDSDLTLCDIKTGKYYDSHPLQAAGYWHMLKRRPQVCFIYLDSILERNPEQKAIVKYFTKYELEKGYEDLLDKYAEFVW